MKFRVATGVAFHHVGEELVLLDLNRGVYFGLDPVGARIWQSLIDGASERDIVVMVESEYEVGLETATEDVRHLLDELRAAGLVEELKE